MVGTCLSMHLSTSEARASSQPPTTITPAGFLVHPAATAGLKAARSAEVVPAMRTVTLSALRADPRPGYTRSTNSGRLDALLIHTYSWLLRLGSPIGTFRPVGPSAWTVATPAIALIRALMQAAVCLMSTLPLFSQTRPVLRLSGGLAPAVVRRCPVPSRTGPARR